MTIRWKGPLFAAAVLYVVFTALIIITQLLLIDYHFSVPALPTVEAASSLGAWQPTGPKTRTRTMRIDDGVFSAEVMEDEDLTAGTRAIRASNIRHAMRPVSLLLLLVQGFFVFLIPAAMFFSGAAYLIEFAHKRRRASAGFEILPPLRA